MNDASVIRYLESRHRVYTQSDLVQYVTEIYHDPAKVMAGLYARVGGDHVGNIKLDIDNYHKRADIGLALDRSAWGKGYGTEAYRLMSEWAFRVLGMRKVCAGVYETNIGSIKALQRAKFSVEATLRKHVILDRQPQDVILLARFASEITSAGGPAQAVSCSEAESPPQRQAQ